MQDAAYANVVAADGATGYIVGPSETHPNEVVIAWDDGREISVPASSLRRHSDGTWRLADADVVPVINEELDIQKRKRVTGSVRVGNEVTQHEERVSMPLTRERAEVRRVLIGKPIDREPAIRREGDTIILPVVEEVAAVQKKLVLKEEVHISRRRTTERHDEVVTLNEQHPVIERLSADGSRVPEPAPISRDEEREDEVQQGAAGEDRKSDDPTVGRPRNLWPEEKPPVRRNQFLRED